MINIKKFQSDRSLQWAVFVDIVMLGLVTINLLLLLFNYSFDSQSIQAFFKNYTPDFYQFYFTYIYKDFLLIDALFITIFIAELSVRWIVAIVRKTYYRWFFYPFIHWYDVLGCIPISSFRFFRVLRVFSILFRLQKAEVIELESTYLFATIKRYYQILVEEISDRVVVNVISGAQEELKEGTPVVDKIIEDILKPRQEVLVEWMTDRTRIVAKNTYDQRGDEIKVYLNELIARAMENNSELETLERVPMLGTYISNKIESAVKDIVYKVMHEAIADLQSEKAEHLVNGVTEAVFELVTTHEEDEVIQNITTEMAVEVMEVLKEQVKVQRWKEGEQK